ncbi:type I phosphomannose isomerase catalytic subunit [Galbibacter mesophilus]|uniref:type I phosphomannose isomerase catalytic subunit n=1 Tax=Galbibacter mesophilus TaxID=379069 RepID=UPI00191FE29B|nr:type I phosphomannose isomerase catalytic subunit [Galbibacter mesophilus]MCM5664242.1 class I mannose-6-phosphate isomerase [Galbibacter mesophilus]
MNLYPIKFTPIFKEYLWGGTKLKEVLGKEVTTETASESWELSGVEGNVSVVSNGELSGKTLQELIDTYQGELLGESVFERFGNKFPILIKFIDAKLDLSVQLHPNDELAKKRHNSFGKTEMWHVMQADEGSKLIVGFKDTLTKETYLEHLKKGTLLEILNQEEVKAGDTYFINTGKVHAIGAGILLAEIQQTSDVTYRIYDYERKDKDGNTRELHTEQAIDAIDYKKKDDYLVEYSKEYNSSNNMVTCDYFITNYLNVVGTFVKQLVNRDSFSIYICVEGKAQITAGEHTENLNKGETILIPAAINEVSISAKDAKILEVHI